MRLCPRSPVSPISIRAFAKRGGAPGGEGLPFANLVKSFYVYELAGKSGVSVFDTDSFCLFLIGIARNTQIPGEEKCGEVGVRRWKAAISHVI